MWHHYICSPYHRVERTILEQVFNTLRRWKQIEIAITEAFNEAKDNATWWKNADCEMPRSWILHVTFRKHVRALMLASRWSIWPPWKNSLSHCTPVLLVPSLSLGHRFFWKPSAAPSHPSQSKKNVKNIKNHFFSTKSWRQWVRSLSFLFESCSSLLWSKSAVEAHVWAAVKHAAEQLQSSKQRESYYDAQHDPKAAKDTLPALMPLGSTVWY